MTRDGPMNGDLERRVEALENSHAETASILDRLLEHAFATDAKLAAIDAKLDAKANASDLAEINAKLDAKANASDLAEISAKLDAKANASDLAEISAKLDAKASAADVAKLEPLVGIVDQLAADIRTLRDNARTDYRVLFGAIITVTLGLAALMAKGFHWV